MRLQLGIHSDLPRMANVSRQRHRIYWIWPLSGIKKDQWVLLLIAGALVTLLAFFVALGSWPDLGALFLVGIFFAPSFLASFLLLLAGLLSFTKTRHLIKKWRDGGWIP